MRIAVVIPAYQVAAPLRGVLARLAALPQVAGGDWRPVVVNDGSSDGTSDAAREGGAVLLEHPTNQGKGAALATGFAFAVREGYDAVVTLDGDGQHEAESIAGLVAAAERGPFDIVIGDRMGAVGEMPALRIATNRLTSWFVSRLARQPIRDSQSGFRLIRCAVLRRVETSCRKYDAESELLIKAGRAGFTIGAAPIRSVYHDDGQSHIHPVRDTIRFIGLVARSLRESK
jgi:glycosyltransferase involved in cell wall biosynthesis